MEYSRPTKIIPILAKVFTMSEWIKCHRFQKVKYPFILLLSQELYNSSRKYTRGGAHAKQAVSPGTNNCI